MILTKRNTTKYYLALIIIIGLFINSCTKDNSDVITQIIELNTFNGIELSIAGNVKIVEGENQKVEITGPEETVNAITKTVKSGIWDINLPNSYHKNYSKLNIIITSDKIEKLILSGSGVISGDYSLPLSSIIISGSGNVDAKAKSSIINTEISGSGNITISGKVDSLEHILSGEGNFKGFALETTNSKINIIGSGNSEVFVTTNLDVQISGSGNVYYKGNPSVTANISGTGQVINAN